VASRERKAQAVQPQLPGLEMLRVQQARWAPEGCPPREPEARWVLAVQRVVLVAVAQPRLERAAVLGRAGQQVPQAPEVKARLPCRAA